MAYRHDLFYTTVKYHDYIPNSFQVMEGGGGGGNEGDMNTRAAIFYTQETNIVMTSSTEPYSLMKIFLTVFKIESIVALTIKGR